MTGITVTLNRRIMDVFSGGLLTETLPLKKQWQDMPFVQVSCHLFSDHFFVFLERFGISFSHFCSDLVSHMEKLLEMGVVIPGGLHIPEGLCEAVAVPPVHFIRIRKPVRIYIEYSLIGLAQIIETGKSLSVYRPGYPEPPASSLCKAYELFQPGRTRCFKVNSRFPPLQCIPHGSVNGIFVASGMNAQFQIPGERKAVHRKTDHSHILLEFQGNSRHIPR